jgi:hypothetical protein
VSVCVVLRAREKRQRERQTNTESEESKRYRERDSSRNRSYHARTHAREKEIGNGELPVADPVPRMRINVPNKTGLMLLVSYFFSRNLLLLASLAPFSSMCACVQARQAERKDNFSCSLSLLSISHFTLSLSRLSGALRS